jgi:hypothetical protein
VELQLDSYFRRNVGIDFITRAADAFTDRSLISLKNPKAGDTEPPKDFYFDAVFGPNSEQKYIYDVCASSVVESVLNGYNGTIFAYGQVFVILL